MKTIDVLRNTPPHFMGIGVPKAGTTWLHHMLSQHPDIWMPHIKEIHFFDEYFRATTLAKENRFFSNDAYIKNRWRRNLKSTLKYSLRYPSIENFYWAYHFLFARHDFNSYKKLFPKEHKICGEITPAYCTLSDQQVSIIRQNFPNIKIILLLRNPVDRAWSHARMELLARPRKAASALTNSEIEKFLFKDNGVISRGNYSDIIRRWTQEFGEKNVFIGLFEDIKNNPKQLLFDLFDFLNIPQKNFLPENHNKTIHKGKTAALDPHIRKQLIEYYDEEIHKIARYTDRPEIIQLWSK